MKGVKMVLQISVKEGKSELFLQLIQELKNSMIDKYHILSDDIEVNDTLDETELLKRIDDIKQKNIKSLSRQEVFDGIC